MGKNRDARRKRRATKKATKVSNKSAKRADRRDARTARITERKSVAVARQGRKSERDKVKFSAENVAARSEARGKMLGGLTDLAGDLVSTFAGGGGGNEVEYDAQSPLLDLPENSSALAPYAGDEADDDKPAWFVPAAVGGGVLTLLALAFLAFK